MLPMNPNTIAVEPLENFRLRITFSNGERRIFDVSPYLGYPAFRRLANPGYFSLAHAHHGTVCWPGDIDFCPDTVYLESIPTESAAGGRNEPPSPPLVARL